MKSKSIKELRKMCQPGFSNPKRNWRDKIYQFISIYITKLILYTSITANQVSLLMIFLGITASLFLMKGNYVYSIVGVLIYHLSILLDWVDGEVARGNKKCSPRGAYLDYLYHSIVTPLLIIGLVVGVYFSGNLKDFNWIFLLFGIIGLYSFMVNGHLKLFPKFIGGKEIERKLGTRNRIKEEFLYFFKFDWPFNFIFFFVIFGISHYAILIYAFFASLMLLNRIYLQFNRY